MAIVDFFRKRERVAGIDFGTSGVKLVVVEPERKRPVVVYATTIDYPEPVSSVVEVLDSVSFVRIMETVWRYIPEKVTKVSFVMPGRLVMVHAIELPKDVANVRGFVEEELRTRIPFALDEISYDIHVFAHGDRNMALCVITKKDVLERCRRILSSMGAEVAVVDTAFTALANLFLFNYPEVADHNAVILLDIGETNTNVVFVKEGNMVLGQCLSDANEGMIARRVAEAAGISVEEALDRLRSGGVDEVILSDATRELCSVISSELMVVGSRLGDFVVDKIYITGGAALNPYMPGLLREFTAVPDVEPMMPLRRFGLSRKLDRVFVEEISNPLSLALGGTLSLIFSEAG